MTIGEFQQLIRRTYGDRDALRGLESTFMWLIEEVGELARALRGDDLECTTAEFADVLAWLTTIATLAGVDLEQAAQRYAQGCPRCHHLPCECAHRTHP
jgi:NTP pyrophosphatase (non-canonical NTP hydrolase)